MLLLVIHILIGKLELMSSLCILFGTMLCFFPLYFRMDRDQHALYPKLVSDKSHVTDVHTNMYGMFQKGQLCDLTLISSDKIKFKVVTLLPIHLKWWICHMCTVIKERLLVLLIEDFWNLIINISGRTYFTSFFIWGKGAIFSLRLKLLSLTFVNQQRLISLTCICTKLLSIFASWSPVSSACIQVLMIHSRQSHLDKIPSF